MKTETAVAELVQTAFEHFGGERDCEAVVLRPRAEKVEVEKEKTAQDEFFYMPQGVC